MWSNTVGVSKFTRSVDNLKYKVDLQFIGFTFWNRYSRIFTELFLNNYVSKLGVVARLTHVVILCHEHINDKLLYDEYVVENSDGSLASCISNERVKDWASVCRVSVAILCRCESETCLHFTMLASVFTTYYSAVSLEREEQCCQHKSRARVASLRCRSFRYRYGNLRDGRRNSFLSLSDACSAIS